MELLKEIPDWLGSAFANSIGWVFTTLVATAGAILKTLWDWFQKSRLPYKSDKARFEYVLSNTCAQSLEYIRDDSSGFVENAICDGIDDTIHRLKSINTPKHLNASLAKNERKFFNSLVEMNDFLSSCQSNHSGTGQVLPNDETRKEKYFKIRDNLLKSFDHYINFANERFAVKISKEPTIG